MLRVTPRGNELVEPEVVATSPCPVKSRVPVCSGFDSLKVVLTAGLAPALATLSTSCLCVGLRELLGKMEPPTGAAPAGLLYKRNPQAAARRQGGRAPDSQSPVPPRTQRAYETHLSAGSTAMMAHGHPNGAPTRSCTGLTRLPSECIADNALGAKELASLTGFAQVISCMRGRRVDWTTPRGQVERVNGVAPSSRPWHGRILLLNHTRRKLVSPAGISPATWRLGRARSVL